MANNNFNNNNSSNNNSAYGNYFKDSNKEEEDPFKQIYLSKDAKNADGVIKAINALLQDRLLPKSVITKLTSVVKILKNEDEELQLRLNKTQEILNQITEDSNLPSFVKTQIWHLAEMLERIEH